MRLTALKEKIICIILFLFLIGAQSFARGQKFTISIKKAPIKNAFLEIEKITGYTFIYTTEILNEVVDNVTISVNNVEIDEVLRECFKSTRLNYFIIEKRIIVAKSKKGGSLENAAAKNEDIDIIVLKGKVLDENEHPLVGASVILLGTDIGVLTNEKGDFAVKSSRRKNTVIISFVGYTTREQAIGVGSNIIYMRLSTSDLEEVQTIAYGKVSKRFQTGNVTNVTAEDIEKQPVSNALLALQGRVPGLDVVQTSGVPGGGVTVRIQGENSFFSGKDPLYIVDGAPYSSQLLSTGLNIGVLGNSGPATVMLPSSAGNPLNYLNPADIESISVLKDADATAIYGSRAANGAILITTKHGKQGQVKVDFNIQNGWARIGREMKLLDSRQYIEMRKEALRNDNVLSTDANAYDIKNLYGWDTTRTMDWQKQLLGGTAKYINASTNISGGSAQMQYLVGVGYSRESTITPGDFSDQKGSLHFNINSVSGNQRFRMQLSGNYMMDYNQLQASDLVSLALRLPPTAPNLYNSDGSLNWAANASGNSTWFQSSSSYNPLAYLYRRYKNKTHNVLTNLLISYRILQGLEAKISAGYTFIQSNEIQTNPLVAVAPEQRQTQSRNTSFGNNNINSWIIEPQLCYNRHVGIGKLDLLIGSTIQRNEKNGVNIFATGFISDALLEDMRSATSLLPATLNSVYKYNALFGRINYTINDKYIVNFTARRDGSSIFGPENRFHSFGAIGGAWIFSEEKYIKDNLKYFSFGKIRASYGSTGNDQIGDYSFLDLYTSNTGAVPYQGKPSLTAVQLYNPKLQWEETRKVNVGVELGFLHDKILLSSSYSRNRSGNQLDQYVLPITTGFTVVKQNLNALIQNTSWEFALTGTIMKQKNFRWATSFNLTIPRNKLLSFENLEKSSYASVRVIGQPTSGRKVFHFLGMNSANGKFVFADVYGNPVESPNTSRDANLFVTTFRKGYGGLSNTISYKSIQVDFLFQFVKTSRQGYFSAAVAAGRIGYNQPITVLNRWQKPGDISEYQRFTSVVSVNPLSSSDAVFIDGSFIRLKNVSISYIIPTSWRKRVGVQQAKIFVHGQNVFILTKSKYVGLDPETGSASIPPLRMITAGIQVGF